MCVFQTPLCIRELGITECWRNVYCSQYLPKAGVFSPERFGDISPVLSGERLCVVWLILSVPRKYFIV